ncbi:Ig-like domain-containing protein [Phocaeicola paurosaccharolyticus]|uniref:Ig-like domain-containing protein n=1 Tax=Phocaeicola paurosaccharolyticus TaxID=732242 RepID=UPI002FE35F97
MKRKLFYVTAIVSLTLFAACSKDDGDDLKITSSRNVELISKKTSQIECSDSKATYASENGYVATVSETGLITGRRIGETYIDVNGQKSIKVSVTPVYTQFTEPQFLFGATKDEVYTKVGTNYSLSNESGIAYTTTNDRVRGYIYLLKDGKVSSVVMVVNSIYFDSLTDFLLERYAPATFSEENYTVLYVNALTADKITMIIGEQVYSASIIYVAYLPYTNSKSRSVTNSESVKLQVKSLLDKLSLR